MSLTLSRLQHFPKEPREETDRTLSLGRLPREKCLTHRHHIDSQSSIMFYFPIETTLALRREVIQLQFRNVSGVQRDNDYQYDDRDGQCYRAIIEKCKPPNRTAKS